MEPRTDLVERADELTPHERRNVIAALRELLTTCHDGKARYEEAAREADDPDLAGFLLSHADEYDRDARQLADLLVSFGGDTDVPPSLGGELHRRFMALRTAIAHGSPAGILAECERGEHLAIGRYERALQMRLPINVASVLLDQVETIRHRRAAFDRMRKPW